MTLRSLAWLPLLLTATSVAAQDTPFIAQSGSRPVIRPDGTYVFNHIPNSNLVFEGQIAPRIIVVDSLGDAAQKVLSADKKPVWGWQISATPMVKLRMFDETSNPVRTPSYMPKGTFQMARFQNLSRATDPDDEEFNRGPIGVWLVDVIPFGHHSNGQNGCLFMFQARDANGDCVDAGAIPSRTINRIDGSFSTNYIEATVHYGRLHLDSEGAPDAEYASRWEWRAGGGFQLNPKGYLGGSIDDELAELYGPTRLIFEGMAARRDAWRCGRVSVDVRIQYIHDAAGALPDVATRAEAVCFPKAWGGAGLFVRAYRGQDYYNLGFSEGITRLQFGITLQRDTFLSFRIRAI